MTMFRKKDNDVFGKRSGCFLLEKEHGVFPEATEDNIPADLT